MADEGLESMEAFSDVTDRAQNGGDLNISNQTDDLDDPIMSSRTTNSNALQDIQEYGATARSPSCNENVEKSSSPNNCVSPKQISNLNLKSVDEEDEFLYGKCNTDLTDKICVKEVTKANSASRYDGWSDDEDPNGEACPLIKLNRENISESESESKFQDNIKFPITEKELKTDKSAHKKQVSERKRKTCLEIISNHLTSGQNQKRSHPYEDFPAEKHPKYEISRTSSFSPSRRHSPHRQSSHASSESDYAKYASSYSRPRYTKSHRRYSPRRCSPDYRHHRRSHERIRRSQRSRSRSPEYSCRNKTYDKRQPNKSPKKTDHPKKKKKCGTGDSSRISLCKSSGNSNKRKSSKKKSPNIVKKDNKKFGDEMANLKASTDAHSKKSDSTLPTVDLSKIKSDSFNLKDSDRNSNKELDADTISQLLNASVSDKNDELIIEFVEKQEQIQQQPIVVSNASTYIPPENSGINVVSNMQMISSSDSYAYPSVPATPIVPQMNNFHPVIYPTAFPAPVMAAPPTPEYGPYLSMSPVSTNDSQCVANVKVNSKSRKVSRPTTLRPIAVSDNLHISPIPSSNITVVPINFLPQKSAKQVLENKTNNLTEKDDEKNASSSFKRNGESASCPAKITSEKNKLLIEKYKKMKNEKSLNLEKTKRALEDLKKMKEMFQETFGKKTSPREKKVLSRCQFLLKTARDCYSQCKTLATNSSANLHNFLAGLPICLREEVSKLKIEPIIEEPTNEKISCFDQGGHQCLDCYTNFPDLQKMFNHFHTAEHRENMEANSEWRRNLLKAPEEEQKNDPKETLLKPVKGAEFLKSLTAFYCTLCKEIFTEDKDAKEHLKRHQHYTNYNRYAKLHTLYETIKEFEQIVSASKQKKLNIEEDKNKQVEEQHKMQLKIKQYHEMPEIKKKQLKEQKKMQDAAEKKAKEILFQQRNRKLKIKQLEENFSEDVYLPSSQKTSNIELNVPHRMDIITIQDKTRSEEEKDFQPLVVPVPPPPSCNKQISSEDMEINDCIVEKLSNDICSLYSHSYKTLEEPVYIKRSEVTVATEANEKINKKIIHGFLTFKSQSPSPNVIKTSRNNRNMQKTESELSVPSNSDANKSNWMAAIEEKSQSQSCPNLEGSEVSRAGHEDLKSLGDEKETLKSGSSFKCHYFCKRCSM